MVKFIEVDGSGSKMAVNVDTVAMVKKNERYLTIGFAGGGTIDLQGKTDDVKQMYSTLTGIPLPVKQVEVPIAPIAEPIKPEDK